MYLWELTFGPNFNESMEKVALPLGLQSLTFCSDFNHSMGKVALAYRANLAGLWFAILVVVLSEVGDFPTAWPP